MTTYELWAHPRAASCTCSDLEEGRVTGCRGPLTLWESVEGRLTEFALRRAAVCPGGGQGLPVRAGCRSTQHSA